MTWVTIVALLIAAVVFAIWFLHRYYAKATLETAQVRTGLGGRKVVIDGGCLALPFVHRLQRVSMEAIGVPVSRTGRDAVMCRDQLRADIVMEFELRVDPTPDGIATAAQAIGSRIARPGETVRELLEGLLLDAIQSAAAKRSLEEIHLDRIGFSDEVSATVERRAVRLGLQLISVAMVSVDQSSFAQLDENNAFHAQGMRRLAEVVSDQRKARVAIETATDIAVRESRLAQHQRQLEIQRAEKESEIAQREHLVRIEAIAESRSSQARAEANLAAEVVRIEKDRESKAAQVTSDEALRRAEMKAILSLEEVKIDNDIQLARKRVEEATEKAREEEAKALVILAAEQVQAKKERAVAGREHETALLRQKKELELDDARVKSEVETMLARAKAKATAAATEAGVERERMEAEAAGRMALYSAENSLSDAVMRVRLEERRIDRMPEIMTQMMKPVEKIESIRINQIGGLGEGLGGKGGSGIDSAFGSAMDQILGMAVRLPAMKQMGEEIGLDFDVNLAGRTADYANRTKPKKEDSPDRSSD